MPLVQARFAPDKITADELFLACREIVPAGMNSPMGRLTPGSIKFCSDPTIDPRYIVDDAFIDIEAFDYEDRRPLDPRAKAIKEALNECFPGRTFSVWPKLVTAGWSSDSADPEFEGSMDMDAAIERVKARLTRARNG